MKTKTYIFTALLLINVCLTSFKGFSAPVSDGYETFIIPSVLIHALAPETPKEATFEEVILNDSHALLESLAPGNPLEADFEDMIPSQTIDIKALAPILPAVADFED